MTSKLVTYALTGAIALGAARCTPEYSSNLTSKLQEASFSDEDFNVKRSVSRLPTGNFCFGYIPENATINGISGDNRMRIFPYFGLKEREIAEQYDPMQKTAKYGRPDGKVRVFLENKDIGSVITNRTFQKKTLSPQKRVQTLGEAEFWMPLIQFKQAFKENMPEKGKRQRDNYVESLDTVAYVKLEESKYNVEGEPAIAIITNPVYTLHPETNRIHISPGKGGAVYVETVQTIQGLSNGILQKDFNITGKVVEKPAKK